jgi:hypothetical protein
MFDNFFAVPFIDDFQREKIVEDRKGLIEGSAFIVTTS